MKSLSVAGTCLLLAASLSAPAGNSGDVKSLMRGISAGVDAIEAERKQYEADLARWEAYRRAVFDD